MFCIHRDLFFFCFSSLRAYVCDVPSKSKMVLTRHIWHSHRKNDVISGGKRRGEWEKVEFLTIYLYAVRVFSSSFFLWFGYIIGIVYNLPQRQSESERITFIGPFAACYCLNSDFISKTACGFHVSDLLQSRSRLHIYPSLRPSRSSPNI